MFALLADDLTGGCDAGAPFAGRGVPTHVWLSWSEREFDSGGAHVFVTSTRNAAPEAAASTVLEAACWLRRRGARIWFKKIDSTCKGNIGAELNALLSAGFFQTAFLAPAHPAMGRRIRHGQLYIGDKEQPELSLVALARNQGLDCRLAPADAPCMVFGAETQDDLDRIVEHACSLCPMPLLTGSGALAASLAKVVELPAAAGRPPAPRAGDGPVTLYAGSENPVTLAQLEHLREHRRHLRDWSVIRVPRDSPAALPEQLPRAVFLTGGDTAEMMLRAAGAAGILLSGETVPGIPQGLVLGGRWDGLRIATKAGGFGAPDAILKIVEQLA